ncbi:MAG: hypothetical protein M3Q12_01495 [Pseudomonadota bacterium]|uniref:hypothetical protein n=1 Tax=Polaromonas sp. TaxID=1869339 RepID=UPI001816677E|nr:hypothetical protein [Polaromonas sp.]MBA3592904.1 hypothetical protein [Polaromonas sp.]MDQ3270830.1 hypothetical protein [Pseudomonadota bacterium]
MSFFQNLFSSSYGGARESVAGPETGPVKMNLDERMAFRREMLFDSVKSTMESRGILSASYRFKVVRATTQELAAFECAWQKSSELSIGNRTYSSDLAPLGGGSKDGVGDSR